MKKNKYDLINREPWQKKFPSPLAKWLYNFSVLGFKWFGRNGGLIWLIILNPAMVIGYITISILLLLFT